MKNRNVLLDSPRPSIRCTRHAAIGQLTHRKAFFKPTNYARTTFANLVPLSVSFYLSPLTGCPSLAGETKQNKQVTFLSRFLSSPPFEKEGVFDQQQQPISVS